MESEDKKNQVGLTIIGSEMNLNGELFSNDDIRIDGKFVGELQTNGKIVISKGGYVEGLLKAKNIVVVGKAKGDFEAENNFKISDGGSFEGSVKSRYINITELAHFEGTCSISPKNKDIVIVQSESSTDIKKLKSTIEPKPAEQELDKRLKTSPPPVSVTVSDDKKSKEKIEVSTEVISSQSTSILTSKISQIKSI